jgi:hypothetical protein
VTPTPRAGDGEGVARRLDARVERPAVLAEDDAGELALVHLVAGERERVAVGVDADEVADALTVLGQDDAAERRYRDVVRPVVVARVGGRVRVDAEDGRQRDGLVPWVVEPDLPSCSFTLPSLCRAAGRPCRRPGSARGGAARRHPVPVPSASSGVTSPLSSSVEPAFEMSLYEKPGGRDSRPAGRARARRTRSRGRARRRGRRSPGSCHRWRCPDRRAHWYAAGCVGRGRSLRYVLPSVSSVLVTLSRVRKPTSDASVNGT